MIIYDPQHQDNKWIGCYFYISFLLPHRAAGDDADGGLGCAHSHWRTRRECTVLLFVIVWMRISMKNMIVWADFEVQLESYFYYKQSCGTSFYSYCKLKKRQNFFSPVFYLVCGKVSTTRHSAFYEILMRVQFFFYGFGFSARLRDSHLLVLFFCIRRFWLTSDRRNFMEICSADKIKISIEIDWKSP